MLSLIRLPMQIAGFLKSNVSPREVAAGVCLAMFLGFIPLNGAMTTLLTIFFFVFRLNRLSVLLTLPLFKFAYLLGLYHITDALGAYLLIHAGFLTNFWRWLTNLPVIAYLDINNTLIAGGLAVSAVFCAPVYFVSKNTAMALRSKYGEKTSNSKFGKFVSRLTAAPRATGVSKGRMISKVKGFFIKPKAGPQNKFLKRLNAGGIALIVAALLAIQLGVGYFVSPVVSSAIVDAINKAGGTRITIDTLRIWPLTLSLSLKGMEVYDPDNAEKLIAGVNDVSMHVSPLALLSKRLVFSRIVMSNADSPI